ncbi:NAD(P)/FAD-dependent oxidoreductase [Agaribacterium haliotis]|uniref:NAD(P)/FAD-dependent oxidoreductase n=1 Tax=Agaribacterium haliotis TaxID=2013869 RepID=UPI000BB58DDB|nr:NAD(P)/FAD-dependent oxidoreductase [Agaribacterium haliotis]
MQESCKRIVIVGGGAGGLELATRLGRKFRKDPSISVLLLDKHPFHIWKPLLHEVASGSLNAETEGIDYRLHARNNGFEFQLGCLEGLDRDARTVALAAIVDDEGEVLVPKRSIAFDYLVIALGSITNDFGIEGVKEHCFTLDETKQANILHKRILNEFLKIKALGQQRPLRVAVVGGGATGVELTAELYQLAETLNTYGFKNVDRSSIQVELVEASDRILAALPERISKKASQILSQLGTKIHCKTTVSSVQAGGLVTADDFIDADICVWAAGVKCRDFLQNIGGLNTNRIHQIVVRETLQSENDSQIYAIGDCASLTFEDGSRIPPRAQSAHQMATCTYKNLVRQLKGEPLEPFKYKDHGSLVSFAEYSSVGVLQGVLGDTVFVEGSIAKRLYVSLYRLHQIALHGYTRTSLLMLVDRINRRLRPVLKLH